MLPSTSYAHDPYQDQKQRPVRRIHAIVHPTLGFPALVGHGGRFDIWLHTTSPKGSPQEWKVTIKTNQAVNGGQKFDLPIVGVGKEGQTIRLTAELPIEVERDHFHLVVRGPSGLECRQPRAVRVLGSLPRNLRFAVISDHQLWDPSWKVKGRALNSDAYPKRGQTDENKAITHQIIREMELLDPDFILYTGDLLFGLDYRKEYREMWDWYHQGRMATFMVPGNHDGYAIYKIRIRENLPSIGKGIVACAGIFPRKRDWWRIWKYIVCVYQDIKNVLFDNLIHDGLVSWKRTFGPPFYSFEIGPYHFVGLNTYDGTNKRRHAFALWLPFRGLKLGAPAVDNYGGYISEEQLRWLEADLKKAHEGGKTVIFFGHHDPRGNPKGERYHKNKPFPTSPVGLDRFEEWNYDSEEWDSDPDDSRGPESALKNSGTRLLAQIARYGSLYISGHVHEDRQNTYKKGETILGPIRAEKDLTFVRVTSAASSVKEEGYWGYRLFTADPRGNVSAEFFDRDLGLLSLPAGNFWKKTTPKTGNMSRILYSALTQPKHVRLRFRLLHLPDTGYSFTRSDQHGESQKLRVASVSPDPNGPLATYFVDTSLPRYTGMFPPRKRGEAYAEVKAEIANNNRAPVPRVVLMKTGAKGRVSIPLTPGRFIQAPMGAKIILDASSTVDSKNKPVQETIWKAWTDGRKKDKTKRLLKAKRGDRLAFVLEKEGTYHIEVTAYDGHGSSGKASFLLESHLPRLPQVYPPRCGCCIGIHPSLKLKGSIALISFLLGFLVFLLWRKRKSS